jgi:hypothetical protein
MSEEILRQVEEITIKEIDLDHTIIRTLQYLPGEIEKLTYRLGDYFERIEMLPDEVNKRLELTFYARHDVDSHWKGLLVAILQSIGTRFAGISVEFPHRSA